MGTADGAFPVVRTAELVPRELCRTLDEARALALDLAKSGYFRDARDACQAMVKVAAGHELGIGPVAAMTGLHVIEGRIQLSSGLIAALIRRSGRYDYRVVEHDDTQCRLAFVYRGTPCGESVFTWAQAEAAGLTKPRGERGVSVWRSHLRAMLFARAISQGARWYCPDVFHGAVYSEGELPEDHGQGEARGGDRRPGRRR